MSVNKPTERQLEALKKLHRSTVGFNVTFCVECEQEVPCRTMKALGEKKK